ncbi:MAG: hypothetical protein H7101_07905 [Deinococcales bacterium]|nr:hypothetical protein [Chitinophagaceae bacterium]
MRLNISFVIWYGAIKCVQSKIILTHLGNGASLAVVKDGKYVEISMGSKEKPIIFILWFSFVDSPPHFTAEQIIET